VDPVFLPLSIRQNRIEDVFARFLEWLAPSPGTAARMGPKRTPLDVAELILEEARKKTSHFRLPEQGTPKSRLVREWIQSELMVESAATNRQAGSDASVVPLHTEIARRFEVPGNPPAYGRFLCEMLARTPSGLDWTLVERLAQFFASDGSDPIARLLGLALGEEGQDNTPRYQRDAVEYREQRVFAVGHAQRFQRKLASVLQYRERVSRRTMLEWLYSLITYFLATYFLRMALAAEAYALQLEEAFEGRPFRWDRSLDDEDFLPEIPYSRRDETHARLMKQFPSATSEIGIARCFLGITSAENANEGDLRAVGAAVEECCGQVDAEEVFRRAIEQYPVNASVGSSFKLTAQDKERAVELAVRSGISSFVTFARGLNWEDMARRTNNVMEWQFYASLARNQRYGFATGLKQGDVLLYKMSPALLTAMVHCHCAESASEHTLASFVESLEELGFRFDGGARGQLEQELVELGMLEALADASDAKRLVPLFELQGAER
jgi:hypothetical protein